MDNINTFDLSKQWFAYISENTNVKSNHSHLYFFILNKWNVLFWKKQFGLPTEHTMQCLNVLSYKTYIKTLLDLKDFGFINIIERSKNQNTANIIEVVNNTKAVVKANTKALLKADTEASPKQVQSEHQSEHQSIDSIIKQINNKQINNKQVKRLFDCTNDFLNLINEDLTSKQITIYSESDFLKNWATCRKKFLKVPTHIPKLEHYERVKFLEATSDFAKEQINLALLGLFKQQNKSIGAMFLKPKHFLENVSKYLNAEMSKNYDIYGKCDSKISKSGGL